MLDAGVTGGATTDEQGRYEFERSAGGRAVTASKGLYVGVSCGQTRPNRFRTADRIDGQFIEKVDVSLPAAASSRTRHR
jgi:hypothetical protein